jgi:hypothetical protein
MFFYLFNIIIYIILYIIFCVLYTKNTIIRARVNIGPPAHLPVAKVANGKPIRCQSLMQSSVKLKQARQVLLPGCMIIVAPCLHHSTGIQVLGNLVTCPGSKEHNLCGYQSDIAPDNPGQPSAARAPTTYESCECCERLSPSGIHLLMCYGVNLKQAIQA